MSASIFSHTELLSTLHQRFGLTHFRGLQESVIQAVLAGQDVLALMPTGAGKSLCYQLPAVLLPGVTLVVFPLVALIRDQTRRLRSLNIPSLAVSGEENFSALMDQAGSLLKQGTIKVILTSPERLNIPHFISWLATHLPPDGLALTVIDEAHCIAEWGRTFRPAYLSLGALRNQYPQTPVLAMTASADQWARKEILQVLRMTDDSTMRSSLNRPELFYRVGFSPAPWRSVIAYFQTYHAHSPAIFYCTMRQETESLAKLLNCYGIRARAYHAGMETSRRYEIERWFADSDNGVMVATVAFGMGVDKSNIRLVAHIGLDHRVASYYQESGRAGRDGVQSDVILILNERESIHNHQNQELENADFLNDPDIQSKVKFAEFVYFQQCRRIALLAGLDEDFSGPCGTCDICAPKYRPLPLIRKNTSAWVAKSPA